MKEIEGVREDVGEPKKLGLLVHERMKHGKAQVANHWVSNSVSKV
jgi:hypothetical protein